MDKLKRTSKVIVHSGDGDPEEEKTLATDSSSDQSSQPSRQNWGRQLDFVLTLVGFAVGLGNIWRFPYLCMRNGGGAFLIPYFCALFLCGMPLFYLEVAIGQFSGQSPTGVWKVCPLFKGIGWSMGLVSGICCTYYNVIIGWVLYYLFNSFTKTLPWANCKNSWNTPQCREKSVCREDVVTNTSSTGVYLNSTQNMTWTNESCSMRLQEKEELARGYLGLSSNESIPWKSPAEEYWQLEVTEMSSGIHELGNVKWQHALCLLLAWAIVFFCLSKGVKSLGKVVYVTATLPYIFLTTLLIRGLLLPGALDGIKFYIVPDWRKLVEPSVWAEACTQIFYSLGPAWGGLITMASYNKFNNNCERDALLVPLINCGTSFYGGFVIFSVIGFMAQEAGLPVDKVLQTGPGLAFIAYPEAIAKLPVSPLWAIIFFLMMLNVGLGTQFGMFEVLVSSFVDQFPTLLRRYKVLVTLSLCVALYLLGIPIVTNGGIYIFQIMDWYVGAVTLMLISILECVVLTWVYGHDRLGKDIQMMIGHQPNIWWKVCWCGISPFILTAIIIFNLYGMGRPLNGNYSYPDWAIGIGWGIALVSLIPIPIFAANALYQQEGTFFKRLQNALRPAEDWGPACTIVSDLREAKAKLDKEIILSLTGDLDPDHETKHQDL